MQPSDKLPGLLYIVPKTISSIKQPDRMRNFYLLSGIAIILLFSGCSKKAGTKNTINPILGDISYISKYQKSPDANVNEQRRIQTHLAYVEQLLKAKNVQNWPFRLQANREKLINLLHEYRVAAKYPKNYDYPDQRKPCFLDKDGNICAVGYLIEQTAGRALAETINNRYKYAEIKEMQQPALVAWVKNSGLTLQECAMIQPTYNGYSINSNPNSKDYIRGGFGISSLVLTGANVAFSTINFVKLKKGSASKNVAFAGLFTGAGQIVLGYENLNIGESVYNNSQIKDIALIDIGVGSAAIIVSSYSLFSGKKKPALQVYGFPGPAKQVNVGFNYTKTF